jgi:tetratricopeptide (TPR) repeat protein
MPYYKPQAGEGDIMKLARFAPLLLALFAATAQAQIGKTVIVPAGSPEDKAINAITGATDPAQKITLLDQFMKDYGSKPDLALLAETLYTSSYLQQDNYDKAIESGEKVMAADPDNFAAAVNLVRAAAGKQDAAKAFDFSDQAAAILARYKAAPPPAGSSAQTWAGQQVDTIKSAQSDIESMQYALFSVASQVTDGAQRAVFLERFLKSFPDSVYAANAREGLAFAYQQAQNIPKMLDAAQQVLAKDPSNVSMLLLLADYYSGQGKQLDDAAADAQKALDTLSTAVKPAQTSQADWDKQTALQKGIAYSALGQIEVVRAKNAPGVESFKQADPLLESNGYYYARNLYRLGFTLAKMKQISEARKYLGEAVKIDSPFRALAQQTLATINGSAPATTRRHK